MGHLFLQFFYMLILFNNKLFKLLVETKVIIKRGFVICSNRGNLICLFMPGKNTFKDIYLELIKFFQEWLKLVGFLNGQPIKAIYCLLNFVIFIKNGDIQSVVFVCYDCGVQ